MKVKTYLKAMSCLPDYLPYRRFSWNKLRPNDMRYRVGNLKNEIKSIQECFYDPQFLEIKKFIFPKICFL